MQSMAWIWKRTYNGKGTYHGTPRKILCVMSWSTNSSDVVAWPISNRLIIVLPHRSINMQIGTRIRSTDMDKDDHSPTIKQKRVNPTTRGVEINEERRERGELLLGFRFVLRFVRTLVCTCWNFRTYYTLFKTEELYKCNIIQKLGIDCT